MYRNVRSLHKTEATSTWPERDWAIQTGPPDSIVQNRKKMTSFVACICLDVSTTTKINSISAYNENRPLTEDPIFHFVAPKDRVSPALGRRRAPCSFRWFRGAYRAKFSLGMRAFDLSAGYV